MQGKKENEISKAEGQKFPKPQETGGEKNQKKLKATPTHEREISP